MIINFICFPLAWVTCIASILQLVLYAKYLQYRSLLCTLEAQASRSAKTMGSVWGAVHYGLLAGQSLLISYHMNILLTKNITQSLASGWLATFSLPFVDCKLPFDPDQTMDNDRSSCTSPLPTLCLLYLILIPLLM